MIKNHYLFPQFYIAKIPYCDECNIQLIQTGMELLTYPPMIEYKCERCNKIYNISQNDLEGEWKWRVL